MYFNARSIVNKVQELKLFASQSRPDVIAITETWAHNGISNNYLKIPSYVIAARHDRNDTQNGRGGGLLVYVREDLQSVETTCQNNFNQFCSVQIASPSNSLHLYVIYRSPNSSPANNEKLLEVMRGVKNPAVVVGDFTYPHANWEILKAKLSHEKKIAKNSKVNPKAFYSYIGGKRSNRTGVGPLQDNDGKIITDNGIQAQMLNNY